MPGSWRRNWDPEEDEAIRRAVQQVGTKSWITVAKFLKSEFGVKNRSGKQIRERWHNHLNPQVQKRPWTLEEDKVLFETQRELGNSWAVISNLLPGRSDNCVKNRFHSTVRREFRKMQGKIERQLDVRRAMHSISTKVLSAIARRMKKREEKALAEPEFPPLPVPFELQPELPQPTFQCEAPVPQHPSPPSRWQDPTSCCFHFSHIA